MSNLSTDVFALISARTTKSPVTPTNWSGSTRSSRHHTRPRSDNGSNTPSRYEDRRSFCTHPQVYQPGMLLQENPSTALQYSPESDSDEDPIDGPEFGFELSPTEASGPQATATSQRATLQSVLTTNSKETYGAVPGDMRTLLQQQQTLLLKILQNQSEMEAKQTRFGAKLTELEAQVQQQMTSEASSSTKANVNGKRKRVVTGVLSVSEYTYIVKLRKQSYCILLSACCFSQKRVCLAHNNSENQFKPEER